MLVKAVLMGYNGCTHLGYQLFPGIIKLTVIGLVLQTAKKFLTACLTMSQAIPSGCLLS